MKKIRIVGIASVILVVGIVALDFNNNRIEHINDQLATNPPAAGDGRTFGDIERARSRINDTTAGFHTKPASLSVYKEIEGNVTSFSDIPTRNYSASTGRGEIIQVNASNPPTTPKPDANQQVKHSKWESQFAMFPQDQDGWSIITPAVDSRMIYVSSTDGNDSKAKAYFSKDIPEPRNPPSSVVAFKTIEAALKLQRNGYPDWVLLKKGDEWQLNKTISLPSGRSNKSPLVITYYGKSKLRPLIKSATHTALKAKAGLSYMAIIGIEFNANKRDPNSTEFVGWNNLSGSPAGLSSTNYKTGKITGSVTLEDNIFRFYGNNIVFTGGDKQKNIILRRNQFLSSYSTTGHSQGLYSDNASMLIEENLFDNNGWYQQQPPGRLNLTEKGYATMFNHNMYLTALNDSVIVGNIINNASSIGIKLTSNGESNQNFVQSKNIVITDNLIMKGEVAISAGGNKDYNNGYRWENMTITNNVLLKIGENRPTNRTLAWHIDANDWDKGVISGNYLLCNSNPSVDNIWGVGVTGLTRDVRVSDNIIYGIKGVKDNEYNMITTSTKENQTGLLFTNNIVSKYASCETLPFSNDTFIAQFIVGAKDQSSSNWSASFTASYFNEKVKTSFVK